jgi:hypothetical protein
VALSPYHIEKIRERVEAGKITIRTLKDDLLDHLCCMIEEKMETGLDFNEAFSESISEFAPQGFENIQRTTELLLQSKNQFMKKLTFIVGACCALTMGLGCVLALLKFSMGHMIFGLAAFAFVLFFIPLDTIRYLRAANVAWFEKVRHILSSISTLVLTIGVLSWVMKLPGANEMIVAGLVVFIGGFLPFQIVKMYRESFS